MPVQTDPHTLRAAVVADLARWQDRADLSWLWLERLAAALEQAGVSIARRHLPKGRVVVRLTGELLRYRPQLLIADGWATARALQTTATILGVPLVLCCWPAGLPAAGDVTGGLFPAHLLLGSHVPVAQALACFPGLSAERVHLLPPAIDTRRLVPRAPAAHDPLVIGVVGAPDAPLPAWPGCVYRGIDPTRAAQAGAEAAVPSAQPAGGAEGSATFITSPEPVDRLADIDLLVFLPDPVARSAAKHGDPVARSAEGPAHAGLKGPHRASSAPALDQATALLAAEALSRGLPLCCVGHAPLQVRWPSSAPGLHRQVLEVVAAGELAARLAGYTDPHDGAARRARLGEAARNFATQALDEQVVLGEAVALLQEIMQERLPRLGKRLLRSLVARGSAPLGALCGRRLLTRRRRPVALAYHQVCDELRGWDPFLMTSRATLEQQVRALLDRGLRPLTMAQQAAQLDGDGDPDPPPSFAVTFDDGYADALEIAAPLLHAMQVPFTVYVITEVVAGRLRAPWYDRVAQAVLNQAVRRRVWPLLMAQEPLRPLLLALPPSPALAGRLVAALKGWPAGRRAALVEQLTAAAGEDLFTTTPRYLDQAGVRRLHDAGVEISSHTASHPLLPGLDDADLRTELSGSRRQLIDLLGSCAGIAYPNGDSDLRVRAAARAAGYRYGVAVRPGTGRDGGFNLGRRMMSEAASAGLDHRFDRAVFLARVEGFLG